jgi:hypothetical protein
MMWTSDIGMKRVNFVLLAGKGQGYGVDWRGMLDCEPSNLPSFLIKTFQFGILDPSPYLALVIHEGWSLT